MNELERLAETLPPEWKWMAVFAPPDGHETEWQAWLAQAQRAEQRTLLTYWASRREEAA
jgi:hypothetical protein